MSRVISSWRSFAASALEFSSIHKERERGERVREIKRGREERERDGEREREEI